MSRSDDDEMRRPRAMTADRPVADREPLRAGMALASALMDANYPGDSGEDVDRLIAELAKRGYRLTSDADDDAILSAVSEARLDAARAHPDEAGLREALTDVAVWLEAEADNPRPDPAPAMRLQASLLRAALAQPAVPVGGAEHCGDPTPHEPHDDEGTATGALFVHTCPGRPERRAAQPAVPVADCKHRWLVCESCGEQFGTPKKVPPAVPVAGAEVVRRGDLSPEDDPAHDLDGPDPFRAAQPEDDGPARSGVDDVGELREAIEKAVGDFINGDCMWTQMVDRLAALAATQPERRDP